MLSRRQFLTTSLMFGTALMIGPLGTQALAAPEAASSAPKKKITPRMEYVVELQDSAIDVRLVLNGVTIGRGTIEDRKISREKINGWMRTGSNELILYAAIPDPNHMVSLLNMKCAVFIAPAGSAPGEGNAIARFEESDKTKLPAGAMQPAWKTTFPSEPFYGPWAWESAPLMIAGADIMQKALQLIGAIIAAFDKNDTTQLLQLFRIYIDETARAYSYSVDSMEKQILSLSAAWKPSAHTELSADAYRFTIEDNQRLMRIERKDGLSIFTTDTANPPTGFSGIFVIRQGDGLAVVRSF